MTDKSISEQMRELRAERPDEWIMDRLIREVEAIERDRDYYKDELSLSMDIIESKGRALAKAFRRIAELEAKLK